MILALECLDRIGVIYFQSFTKTFGNDRKKRNAGCEVEFNCVMKEMRVLCLLVKALLVRGVKRSCVTLSYIKKKIQVECGCFIIRVIHANKVVFSLTNR